MRFSKKKLRNSINLIKFNIIKNSHVSKTPHLASCLSCTDIITYLYFNIMDVGKIKKNAKSRDRFILSKGHAAPALFNILAYFNVFNKKKLLNYGKDGSIFGEHPPHPKSLAGIESATGSLGHGLPTAVGIAIGLKKLKTKSNVYCLIGDGECGEGTIWESAIIASANKLDNLILIIDNNGWQATDKTKNIMGKLNFKNKWKAFNWDVFSINGNNIDEIHESFKKINKNNSKPTVIIANTTKGSGVKFMENNNNWHYRIPNSKEVQLSKQFLNL